jgi:hypothetical protein
MHVNARLPFRHRGSHMQRMYLHVGYGMAPFPCDAHVVLFREAATGKATATKLTCLHATMPTGGTTSASTRRHSVTGEMPAAHGQCMFSLGPPLV